MSILTNVVVVDIYFEFIDKFLLCRYRQLILPLNVYEIRDSCSDELLPEFKKTISYNAENKQMIAF